MNLKKDKGKNFKKNIMDLFREWINDENEIQVIREKNVFVMR